MHGPIAWRIRVLGNHLRACDAAGISLPIMDFLGLIGHGYIGNGLPRQNRGTRSAWSIFLVCAARLRTRCDNLGISFRPGYRDIRADTRFAAGSGRLYEKFSTIWQGPLQLRCFRRNVPFGMHADGSASEPI
jgi:hypothetical protein